MPFPLHPITISDVVRRDALGIEGLVAWRNLGEEAPGVTRGTSRENLPCLACASTRLHTRRSAHHGRTKPRHLSRLANLAAAPRPTHGS